MGIPRDPYWVTPKDMKTFYVYALFDTSGFPFYVGKGKGYRVNNHLKPTLLKEKSYKNNKIKKLLNENGFVRRDILCYFDSEDAAYEYEEYLINFYKIHQDGGILTNVVRSRNELSKEVYIRKSEVEKVNRQKSVPDDLIIDAYFKWKYDFVSILSLATDLDISCSYLGKIFEGKKRKDLGLTIEIPSRQSLRSGLTKQKILDLAEDRFKLKMSYGQLIKKHNLPKTTIARILKMEGVYSFLKPLYLNKEA